MPKGLVETSPKLGVHDVKCALQAGDTTLDWDGMGEVRLSTVGTLVVVSFYNTRSAQEVKVSLHIDKREAHFGGEIWQFQCPGCMGGARMVFLYGEDALRCRSCAGLTYKSSRFRRQPTYEFLERPLAELAKVRDKLARVRSPRALETLLTKQERALTQLDQFYEDVSTGLREAALKAVPESGPEHYRKAMRVEGLLTAALELLPDSPVCSFLLDRWEGPERDGTLTAELRSRRGLML